MYRFEQLQILQNSPLFDADSQEGVLKKIEDFHKHLGEWKSKAIMQSPSLFDERIWTLIVTVQLLCIDPHERISTKDARLFIKENFVEK
jgi:hypothetical protein